jgi:hypothetical protein
MSIMPLNPFHSYAPASSNAADTDDVHDALEVTVAWGDTVLLHEVLSPPRTFSLEGVLGLPEEAQLGHALVSVENGRIVAHVPSQAQGTYTRKSGAMQVSALSNYAQPRNFELGAGESATFTLGTLTFRVGSGSAPRAVAASFFEGVRNAAFQEVGLSFLLHAAMIGSLAFFMPRMGADDAEAQDRDQLLMMQKFLNASADREQLKEESPETQDASGAKGGAGQRAIGEEGKMGSTVSKAASGRWQKQGPADNPNPQISRKEELAEAREFGLLGLLASSSQLVNAPTASWAEANAKGRDANDFNGHMWDADVGDSAGAGGLGLTGTGENGGGKGYGVGLGNIGTIGSGSGNCTTGPCDGMGNGSSPLKGGHVAKAFTMRPLQLQTNGRIPAEVIQRTVRSNFGRYRACYESALRTNPSLTGRVSVKFIIGRDGAVASAQDGGSDIPDQSVIACVTRSFTNLSFPSPEGGIVTVVYPLLFQPGQ